MLLWRLWEELQLGRSHEHDLPIQSAERGSRARFYDRSCKKDLDIAIKFSKTLGVPISLAIQAEKFTLTPKRMEGVSRIGLQFLTCFKRNSIKIINELIPVPAIQRKTLFSLRFPLPSSICDGTFKPNFNVE